MRLLALSLKRRQDLLLVFAAFSVLTFGVAFRDFEVTEQAEEDKRAFEIDVYLPRANTLEDSTELFSEVEAVMADLKEELELDRISMPMQDQLRLLAQEL